MAFADLVNFPVYDIMNKDSATLSALIRMYNLADNEITFDFHGQSIEYLIAVKAELEAGNIKCSSNMKHERLGLELYDEAAATYLVGTPGYKASYDFEQMISPYSDNLHLPEEDLYIVNV